MGWTYLYTKPQSIPKAFKEKWEHQPGEDYPGLRIIKQAFVGRSVLYGVSEIYTKEKVLYRFATITLCEYRPKSCTPFGYKDLDENCGPVEDAMPMTLLKELFKAPSPRAFAPSENTSRYGTEWRKRCLKNALCLEEHSLLKKARRVKMRSDKYYELLTLLKKAQKREISYKEYLDALKGSKK